MRRMIMPLLVLTLSVILGGCLDIDLNEDKDAHVAPSRPDSVLAQADTE